MSKSFVVLEVVVEVPGISTPEEAERRARAALYSHRYTPRFGSPSMIEVGRAIEAYLASDDQSWEEISPEFEGETQTQARIPQVYVSQATRVPLKAYMDDIQPRNGPILIREAEHVT